ncbi:sulfite oxidase [Haloparvum sp. AD34]
MTNVRDVSRRELFTEWLTSVEDHHVSQHGDVPDVDPANWTVSLTGDVDDPAEITVDELREEFPSVTVAHTMECAGNGRAFFEGDTGSPNWTVGGVSTAFWTGVPIREVLERYGALDDGGAESDGDGADADRTDDDRWITAVGGDRPTDETAFARSIPVSKAADDCILAYAINGNPLPLEHGKPVRVIVPGWYGVNSVKWLTELRVMDRMVVGDAWDDDLDRAHWQQDRYRIHPAGEEPTHRESVDTVDTEAQLRDGAIDHPYTFEQLPKSIIGYPTDGETVAPRRDGQVEVLGMAWAGDAALETVEVSTDGGETWGEASFLGPDYAGAWRLFRYLWTPDPGDHTLVSRAADDRGRRQPPRLSDPVERLDEAGADEFPWNRDGYGANASLPHAVEVSVAPE